MTGFNISMTVPEPWSLSLSLVCRVVKGNSWGDYPSNTNAVVTTPENHEFDLAPRLLDDPDGVVDVSRRLPVDGEDFVVLPHPEPLGLPSRDHPGHENPGVLLLILVQSPVDESQV